MNEIWKEIEGYDGVYLVSNLGRVKSFKNNKESILKPYISSRGYYTVMLYKNNKRYNVRVHRLVTNAFIPNPENKPQVNHVDADKLNNQVTNLEWVTPSENVQHAYKMGLCEITTKEANESRKKPVFSSKLNMQFESTVEAANYVQTHYFENITFGCLQASICLLLNNKITKSKFDFGWQYQNKE